VAKIKDSYGAAKAAPLQNRAPANLHTFNLRTFNLRTLLLLAL